MVETPLGKVARLLGGVVLMQGRLGHQVLGQMLIAGTSELAVAGAAVAISATERVRNPAAQVAIRTAAPAIALTALFERREQLLRYREGELRRRARAIDASDFALETQNGVLKRDRVRLGAVNGDLQARIAVLDKRTAVLDKKCERYRKVGRDLDLALKFERSERSALKSHNDKLQQANKDLQAEVAALHKTNALAEQVHHDFQRALKRSKLQKSNLKNDNARCVVEKYILQRRNNDLREEIKALKTALGANETTTAPADADEAPPEISRLKRKRAKRQIKKRKR